MEWTTIISTLRFTTWEHVLCAWYFTQDARASQWSYEEPSQATCYRWGYWHLETYVTCLGHTAAERRCWDLDPSLSNTEADILLQTWHPTAYLGCCQRILPCGPCYDAHAVEDPSPGFCMSSTPGPPAAGCGMGTDHAEMEVSALNSQMRNPLDLVVEIRSFTPLSSEQHHTRFDVLTSKNYFLSVESQTIP